MIIYIALCGIDASLYAAGIVQVSDKSDSDRWSDANAGFHSPRYPTDPCTLPLICEPRLLINGADPSFGGLL